MDNLRKVVELIKERITDDSFIRLTLSKPRNKHQDLKKVLIKLIPLKSKPHLSFTLRHSTKDITKNYSIENGLIEVERLLEHEFLIVNFFTSIEDANFEIFPNGKNKLRLNKPTMALPPARSHNKLKNHIIKSADYLVELGVTDKKGHILKAKGDKFKQINKFVEIIATLFQQNKHLSQQKDLQVIDMGAGKGYLTFALYDYLVNTLNMEVKTKGIEIRPDLVKKCNQIAQKVGFDGLRFEEGYISKYPLEQTNLLIALHACDTATDDAIFKGIQAGADIIICAPCCHKQIRKQMKKSTHLSAILNYGILKERQAEMVTDAIRALILEAHGYKTKVFEFISTEHTGKNVMIIGEKRIRETDSTSCLTQVQDLKTEFGIEYHYLERLLNN